MAFQKCYRCKKHDAVYQWKVCADNQWRPVCTTCDQLLNLQVLQFFGDPNAALKSIVYADATDKKRQYYADLYEKIRNEQNAT